MIIISIVVICFSFSNPRYRLQKKKIKRSKTYMLCLLTNTPLFTLFIYLFFAVVSF